MIHQTERKLDWTDRVFKNAPILNAAAIADGLEQAPCADTGEYKPVFIEGIYTCSLLENWPGVGYSRVPFKMKAYVDDRGIIYYPQRRKNRKFTALRPGIRAYGQS